MKKQTLKISVLTCLMSMSVIWYACQKEEISNVSTSEVNNNFLKSASDGAHNGNEHFYFLPPLMENPDVAGIFDSSLNPTVEICELDNSQCIEPPIAIYTMSSGYGSEMIRMDSEAEHYIVNWHTDEFDLDPSLTYRINVLVDLTLLGYADVDVASSGKELQNIDTDEFIALKDGRTLPIKFRIEEGAIIQDISTEGLIAWYPFNGNAIDESDNDNDGTVYGASLTEDRHGVINNAFLFDGINDYISCGNDASLKIYPPLSISVWVNTQVGDVSKIILSKGDQAFRYYAMGRRQGNFTFRIEASAENDQIQDGQALSNIWQHIVGVHDGSNVYLYVDGEFQNSLSAQLEPDYQSRYSNSPLTIAIEPSYMYSSTHWFEGKIDDIRIYNCVLTEFEINVLYNE